MINLEDIRNKGFFVYNNLKKRNFELNVFEFYNLDNDIKMTKKNMYNMQYRKNLFTLLIQSFKSNLIKYSYLISEIFIFKNFISVYDAILKDLEKKLENFLLFIPNVLHKSVPLGQNSKDNIEIRNFNSFKNYDEFFLFDLESNKNYIDFGLSAEISGSGFVILKKEIAQLYRSLGNYMIDLHVIEHGYEEIHSPLMINENSLKSTGHLPKFSNDLFKILDFDLWLIPTAEVILTNLMRNKKIFKNAMPLNYVSKTSCFRKEKGNYGCKVNGLIRQHQFDKVELVKIVEPASSYNYLEELTFHAEKILQNLNLSYRVISLCSGDIGFSASKTYDLEVWFPKRKMYVEVSSCSNTETFQSIRMKTKIKSDNSKFFCYPHVLNGSALAIGRVFLALIENYSDSLGNLIVPDVLIKYMNGQNLIKFI